MTKRSGSPIALWPREPTPSGEELSPSVRQKWVALQRLMRGWHRVIVAYSGGVDSSLVLKVAHDVLQDNVLGVIADSPSLPRQELQAALAVARHIGARVRIIETNELENPNYATNPSNRCYFCKATLHDALWKLARSEGYHYILDGTNADDVGDFRPGQEAARERGVRSPLLEVGLTKAEVRALARYLGLPNWNKPAMACLSSRVPYGTPITPHVLRQIEAAETALRALGFPQCRVRHHETVARIEVPVEDFPRLLAMRERVIQSLRAAGYTYITLDLAGFRSGSSNEVLTREQDGRENTL